MTAPAPTPERDNPFWDWSDAAVLLLSGVLFVGIATGVALVMRRAIGNSNANWVAMSLIYVFWFGALAVLFKTKYGRPFWESLAWTYPRTGKAVIFFGGPALALSVSILGILFRTPQTETAIRKMAEGPYGLVAFGIFSVLLGPIAEELAFRGFFMPLLVRSLGPIIGIVITALPFAILHGPEYNWQWQFVTLIALAGIAFGAVRHWTRSTFAAAIMHSAYNLTFFAALVADRLRH